MVDKRVTLRRRSSYRTRSNRIRKVKTSGGRLKVQYLRKKAAKPICGDTGAPLIGVKALRSAERSRAPKRSLTVSRTYGGVLSGKAVKERYVFVYF